MQSFAQTLLDANAASIDFLKVEVHTGLTFARIAHHSTHEEKTERNRAQARLAYDTVLRFIGRVSMTDAESASLTEQMAELKQQLKDLGELF
jgi:hypothetical protein